MAALDRAIRAEDMKGALELRYRLIPYHYSFAHMMFEGRRLWMRPMEVAFPDAAAVAGVTSQWMDGEILVAPVVDSNSMRKVILPNGTWHMFDADGPPGSHGVRRAPSRGRLCERDCRAVCVYECLRTHP